MVWRPSCQYFAGRGKWLDKKLRVPLELCVTYVCMYSVLVDYFELLCRLPGRA